MARSWSATELWVFLTGGQPHRGPWHYAEESEAVLHNEEDGVKPSLKLRSCNYEQELVVLEGL